MHYEHSAKSALAAEAEDNDRLRKSKEALDHYREAENQARKALAEAVARTARMKEKYESIFHECQQRMVARRKAGLIVNNPGY